jgi:Spy/CpxP family protein refolding chaperone
MTRLIVMVCFMAAFAAGLTVGIKESRTPEDAKESRSRRCGGLSSELNLSSEQREQMRQIWSEMARRGGREREERRRELWREKDQAIAELIRPEDRPRYDEVVQNYSEKMRSLEREWRTSFETAVEQTRQILSREQREKYEKILDRHRSERGRGWYRGGWGGRPPATAPATTSPST